MFWTVVLEKTLESPLDCKEIQPVHPKGNQSWIFIGRTDTEAPILGHLMRRADSLEKTLILGKTETGGKGNDRWWDGWMASLTQWTWVWVDFRSWWWTGKPGVLQSMGSQRVGHDLETELNWTYFLHSNSLNWSLSPNKFLIYLFIFGYAGSSLVCGLFSTYGERGQPSSCRVQDSLVEEHGL